MSRISPALASHMVAIVAGSVGAILMACSGLGATTPTPDTQATVNAAVAATGTAAAGVEATVASALAATQTASAGVQATAAADVEATTQAATVEPAATPTVGVDYVALSEEELTALINEAVNEAVAANQAYTEAVNTTTGDGSLTAEEIQQMEAMVYMAEETIAYAEDLIALYNETYAELAFETIELLQDVEDDLEAMLDYAEAMTTILEQNSETLEQGLELATDTITQMQQTAQAAADAGAEISAQTEQWTSQLEAVRDRRVTEALAQAPDHVPADRLAAIVSGFQYADTIALSFQDGAISPDELRDIAQKGANAQAGLSIHGGAGLDQLAGSIPTITEHVAAGQWTQARGEMRGFETGLGERPAGLADRPAVELPDRPSISKPELPRPRK